jgi:PAS domain S-box-containing protein
MGEINKTGGLNLQNSIITEIGLLKSAINLLPNPVYIKDRNHQWVEVNQAFCDFLGYPREALIGKSDFDFNPAAQARIFWEKDNLVFTTKRENRNVEQTTNSQGELRWVKSTKTFFQSAENQEYLIGVLEDITEEKLREKKLVKAERLARRSVRERAKFLANMGHDIRTPLDGLEKVSEILSETPLDEEQIELVEVLKRTNGALIRIVDDILDLSRVDAGVMKLVNAPFNLTDVTENLSSVLGMTARDKGVDLIMNIAPDLPESVFGDSQRLQQILMNLMENAIKYTDNGFVSLTIGGLVLGNDSQLKFTVKDTGIGIPANKMKALFGKLASDDGSLSQVSGVSGIGISLCKKLAQLMGGTLGAVSVEGEGSEFTLNLTLPIHENSRVEPSFVPLIETDQSHKILIVDDIRSNFEMLSVLLESLNMKADYAESARRAAQKLAQAYREGNPYTLMMVDYCMPETDGLLLTAHLRQNAKFANLNIIAVSAVNDPEIMQSFMAHGVIDYLVKPVRLNSLKASLSKVPNMQLLSAA